MSKSTWIICITKRNGQGWQWYADANTTAEIEAAFNRAERHVCYTAVAAFRHAGQWWESKPKYIRNLEARPDAPIHGMEFVNRLDSSWF